MLCLEVYRFRGLRKIGMFRDAGFLNPGYAMSVNCVRYSKEEEETFNCSDTWCSLVARISYHESHSWLLAKGQDFFRLKINESRKIVLHSSMAANVSNMITRCNLFLALQMY